MSGISSFWLGLMIVWTCFKSCNHGSVSCISRCSHFLLYCSHNSFLFSSLSGQVFSLMSVPIACNLISLCLLVVMAGCFLWQVHMSFNLASESAAAPLLVYVECVSADGWVSLFCSVCGTPIALSVSLSFLNLFVQAFQMVISSSPTLSHLQHSLWLIVTDRKCYIH